jgi:tetratricopeptide (TPR) repeat protein
MAKTPQRPASKPRSRTSSRTNASWWSSFAENTRLQAIALAILAFALYAQTLRYGYVWDDKAIISEHKFVSKGFAGLPEIFTHGVFEGSTMVGDADQSLSGGRYRPLSQAMFAVEWQLFGGKPAPMHVVNVLLNVAVVLVLFLFLRQMQAMVRGRSANAVANANADSPTNGWRSALATLQTAFGHPLVPLASAALFAAHPAHTEAVANIKGRDEILCLLFSLTALLFVLRFQYSRAVRDIVVAGLSFAFALVSKETAITLVFVAPFTAWFCAPSQQTTSSEPVMMRDVLLIFGVMLVIGVAFFLLRAQVVGFLDTRTAHNIFDNPFLRASSAEHFATAVAVLGRYLVSVVFPFTLAFDYSYNALPIVGWMAWQPLCSLLVHGVLIMLAVVLLREKHVVSYCLWFYFATISIVSNLVFNIGALMGDRFLYMPSVGITLLTACLLAWAAERFAKHYSQQTTYFVAASLILCAVYSLRTVTRNVDWRSDEALVLANVQTFPDGIRERRIHAGFLQRQATQTQNPTERMTLLQEALDHLQACLRVDSTAEPKVYSTIGQQYMLFMEQYDSADVYFRKAVALDSSAFFRSYVFMNTGNRAAAEGRYDDALAAYRTGATLGVSRPTFLFNTGVVQTKQNQYAAALQTFLQLEKEDPRYSQLQNAIAICRQKIAEEQRQNAQ